MEQKKKKKIAVQIDDELRKYRREMEREIKILLLGAGDSGKSTVFKQMRIIHLQGFTEEEREKFRPAVICNLINCLQCFLKTVYFKNPPDEKNERVVESILHFNGFSGLTPEIRAEIVSMAGDRNLKRLLQTENSLPDAAPHFITHAERIMSENFIPTVDDILRTRVKTMGIAEITFSIEHNTFRLVDVGGQRSERRKWIHCFAEVTAIIFCLALSEYNQVLEEDRTVNRMHESLVLFKEICDSDWFSNVALILFLNKSDLFQEKITRVKLDVCFPDYRGSSESQEATDFIKRKFIHLDRSGKKKIYPHVTVATNTENIQFVFEAVKDVVIQTAIAGYTQQSTV